MTLFHNLGCLWYKKTGTVSEIIKKQKLIFKFAFYIDLIITDQDFGLLF